MPKRNCRIPGTPRLSVIFGRNNWSDTSSSPNPVTSSDALSELTARPLAFHASSLTIREPR